MTQMINCRTLFGRALGLKTLIFAFLGMSLFQLSSFACDLPSDFPQVYKDILEFSKDLNVTSIHGVDECLGLEQKPLKWVKVCDDAGNFKSMSAELFLLPKVTFSFNDKNEFKVENFYFSDWNYSKVDDSEVAEVFIKRGKELKLIYTTQSARKVHLTLVKDSNNMLETFENLVYKMNIGTPSLESKFSCFQL